MSSPVSAMSASFPYQSKYVDVLGSRIHYVEEGKGEPIVFIHGMLMSNYVWRNIIPALAPYGRCIAMDLIGMGKSDKPDISYSVFEQVQYVEKFIETLQLKNVTLVLHGFGSIMGFAYAMRHQTNVKALAFVESYVRIVDWNTLSLAAQEVLVNLQQQNDLYKAVVIDDILLQKALPAIVLRKLNTEELAYYRQPFLQQSDRRVLWQFVQDIPLFNRAAQSVNQLIDQYSHWLQTAPQPKLMLYAVPGFITPISTVEWARQSFPNLQIADLGEALYCPQETNPQAVSQALSQWYAPLI